MKRNKDGMAAAIAAAAAQSASAGRAHPALPRGTIGAVRAGVSGIQEIFVDDVLPWGPQDRLGVELTAVNNTADLLDLASSIKDSGQQVPVLLRPSNASDGKFEVIYGRRRILACKQLGIAVKALVRTMDDGQALLAKGLENASRESLSFYERARFAKAILEQGYNNEELMQALAISKNTLSQFNRITKFVPDDIGDLIGAAPKSGRSKWETISNAFRDDTALEQSVRQTLNDCPKELASDDRLETVLQSLKAPSQVRSSNREISKGVSLKSSQESVTIAVKKVGDAAIFAQWLEENIEVLIQKALDEAG